MGLLSLGFCIDEGVAVAGLMFLLWQEVKATKQS